jgi:hypothetical protein
MRHSYWWIQEILSSCPLQDVPLTKQVQMYKALIVVLASYWRDWSVHVRCCVHLSAEACTTDAPAVQLMLHELQGLHGWLQVGLYQLLYQLVIKAS